MGIDLRFFRKRKTEPKDYHEIFGFLSEDEKVVKDLEAEWKTVRHGWRLEDRTNGFRWGELRDLLLTDRRLIVLKGLEIDYEIPIDNIKRADWKVAEPFFWGFVPYLRMELKNGDAVSLAFVLVGTKKRPNERKGSYFIHSGRFLAVDARRIIDKWMQSINQLCGAS